MAVKGTNAQISPEEYILAPLSARERLEAALDIARKAFEGTSLSHLEVEAAVQKVRRRLHAQRQKKAKGRH